MYPYRLFIYVGKHYVVFFPSGIVRLIEDNLALLFVLFRLLVYQLLGIFA